VGPYGRVPHLQPVKWSDGWPLMGDHGAPVPCGDTGLPAFDARVTMQDDFRSGIGLNWQWQANPDPAWYSVGKEGLRLFAVRADDLFSAGNFLSELMQARSFEMETRVTLHGGAGDIAGLAMMGYTYHYIALGQGVLRLVRGEAKERGRWADTVVTETTCCTAPYEKDTASLIMRVCDGLVRFYYRDDRGDKTPLGGPCPMTPGGWTGARPGIFALDLGGGAGGYADFRTVSAVYDHEDGGIDT